MDEKDISYLLNEYGEERDLYFNAVSPPIMQTSNFVCNTVEELRKAFQDEYSTFLYSRGRNPTVDILCKKLAALDEAEDCLVFSSGAAAIYAAVVANVKSGDHIISVKHPYTWAQKTFEILLSRFGVTHTYVDGILVSNFAEAILPNTAVIYLETPNSWDYAMQDLESIANLAKQHNITTIADNSYCTPLYQKPIRHGIDLVLQSATKYISGHSDVIAGVLCGSKQRIKKIFHSEFMSIGSGISPFNAWLLLRGLRTMPIRLEKSSRTAQKVIDFLKQHPLVEKVLYPFDEECDQLAIAKKQMTGAGGLLSFIINATTVEEIETFCNSLQHIPMAVSWGGYESLILPRCAAIRRPAFDADKPMHRMVRLYVGLEDADYLVADLEQAFGKLQNRL